MAASVVNSGVEPPFAFGEESNVSLTSKVTNDSDNLSEVGSQIRTGVPSVACLPDQSLDETENESIRCCRFIAPRNLREYQWPASEKNAEQFVLEEQLNDFLNIRSQQKYPELFRRPIEDEEKEYLLQKGVLHPSHASSGLTALKSREVIDLLMKEYPQKHEEFAKMIQDNEQLDARRPRKESIVSSIDKGRMSLFVKKAVRSAAEYNAFLMRERREERRAYYDLQTGIIQFPKHTMKRLGPEQTKVGLYPVAVIHGQFAEPFKRYSSDELKYFPLNTATYSLPKVVPNIYSDPGHIGDTDESSSDSESTSESDSSCSAQADRLHRETGKEVVDKSTKVQGATSGGSGSTSSFCRLCGLAASRDPRLSETLIQCFQCDKIGHPSCFGLTGEMLEVVTTYDWLCMDCKICTKCNDPGDEEKMMFCDRCDRGYHTFCVGLKDLPTGSWECPLCSAPKSSVKRQRK